MRFLLGAAGLAIAATALVSVAGVVMAEGQALWGFPGSSAVWSLGFVAAGFLADRARPDIPVGILMMLAGVSAALQELFTQVVFRFGGEPGTGLSIVSQALSWTWMIPLSFMITALLRFPDGTVLGPMWRRVEILLWGATLLAAITFTFAPSTGEFGDVNPLEVTTWSAQMEVAYNLAYILWQLVSIVAVSSIVVRLRRSAGIVRQQVKWVAFAGATVAMLVLFVEVAFRPVDESLYQPATALVAISVLFVPIAMTLAMLRFRLYDIDRVVSRSVAYSLVAAVLGLVYAGGVVAVQTISPASNNLAVAGSTLAVAVSFNPVRRRMQRLVDRRFNRAAFNAELEVDTFSRNLGSAPDADSITNDLAVVLRNTIQPSSAFVWIRGEPHDSIRGS